MNANVKKLLRKIRKESGYAHFREWEPGWDNREDNPNRPFKPQVFPEVPGAPSGELFEKLADHWGGDFGTWNCALRHAKVGTVIDFYITKIGDELETNIEVWIKSETEAYWSEIGGKPRLVTI